MHFSSFPTIICQDLNRLTLTVQSSQTLLNTTTQTPYISFLIDIAIVGHIPSRRVTTFLWLSLSTCLRLVRMFSLIPAVRYWRKHTIEPLRVPLARYTRRQCYSVKLYTDTRIWENKGCRDTTIQKKSLVRVFIEPRIPRQVTQSQIQNSAVRLFRGGRGRRGEEDDD